MENKVESKKTEKKGLVEKITDRVQEWRDNDAEANGFPISAAVARLLRERPGSEYIGTSFTRLCREVKDGVAGPWTPYRPGLVATEEKIVVQEFCVASGGLNGYREILCSMNGQEPVVIGHRISLDVLKKMKANNALTEAGLKMLNEQSGAEAEEAVETK